MAIDESSQTRQSFKKKSLDELYELAAGYKPTSSSHQMCMTEIRRRERQQQEELKNKRDKQFADQLEQQVWIKWAVVVTAVATILLLISSLVKAHPGRMDAKGGHYNRKTIKHTNIHDKYGRLLAKVEREGKR